MVTGACNVSDTMGKQARGGSGFSYTMNDSGTGVIITRYWGEQEGEKLEIPATIDGYPVTEIGDYAFMGRWVTGELVIPNTVTRIGVLAFSDCSKLTGDLIIPESVTEIGYGAFKKCSGFTGDLIIPNGITSIENSTFFHCSGLDGKLVLPESLTKIGEYAFCGCSGLTGELVLPESLTEIQFYAFDDCSGFSGDLIIPDGVTSIGYQAFYGCSGFDGKLVLPKGITEIKEDAFRDCSGLTGDLVLPEGITTIGRRAFYSCSGFTGRLVIPKSITTIEEEVFAGCSGFQSLVLQSGLKSIEDEAFLDCSGLTGQVVIPEGVTRIGRDAFYACKGLTSAVLPKSLKEAEYGVFSYSDEGFEYGLPITIYCPKGSWAYQWAEDCGYKVVDSATISSAYKIEYVLNGGKNSSSNPSSYTKKTATITLKNPTRTGYTFGGWYSDSKFKTKVTQIKKGSTGNKTLYAKWTANKYTISFSGNGATSGKMSSLTSRKYGTSYTLTTNAYKKTGYTFAGWNTRADGKGTTYANKASVKNLTSKNGGKVTLYAQWKKNSYKITYNLNGGKNSKSNPSKYTISSATIKFKNPSKTGYTFNGWYTSSKYKTKITQIKKGSTGNKTLYAKWTANKYTISFSGNGATSGKMSSLTSRKYGTSYKLTTNAFKKTGYTFTGWNTRADGKGTTYANKASVKNLTSKNGGKVTLYAQWKKNNYKITYNLNGGKNHSGNPSSYTITTSTIKFKNPTKTGYTFKGWYTSSKYKTAIKEIKKGSTGNKTLYAKWAANSYTIAFDGNGATEGKMNSLTSRKYGTSYTLTDNKFEKEGYTFVGWNTEADGSGTAYDNKASVKNLVAKNGGKIILYAQWQMNEE